MTDPLISLFFLSFHNLESSKASEGASTWSSSKHATWSSSKHATWKHFKNSTHMGS